MPKKPRQITKLLAANRSEIAIRIFRGATELGLKTVGVYAEEDRFSVHRFKADEAYKLDTEKGPVGAYLDIDGVIAIAKEHHADAIHPGYGFLSENAEFARACIDNNLIFIGPRPEVLDSMGDKIAARAQAQKIGVPTLPGTEEPISDREEALVVAREIGFPLIIKAAFGGGGRGMRVVNDEKDLPKLLDEARTEAKNAFGNDALFLERFIQQAKHIEVQIIGDHHGNVIHLHERDCSVQRRHQKVIEIAPAIDISDSLRSSLCEAAVKIAKAINYDNAGTVEFLVDSESGDWFFIEMNPRIQVEHTVTEEITNIDIVRTQILIAQGHEIHGPQINIPEQDKIKRNGVAVQCRITTEDPENNFTPDTGKILTYRSASGHGIRLDGGLGAAGATVTPYYDSMLVKLTTHAPDFTIALQRVRRALREFRIRGVKTNIPFLLNLLDNPEFASGNPTTRLIDKTPDLFKFKPRKDRATKLLNFLGDVIVNGNTNAKGQSPSAPFKETKIPDSNLKVDPQPGTRDLLKDIGPEKFTSWVLEQKPLLITDTTLRDAHQSLLATRVRSYDMLNIADAIARRAPNLFSLEMWGGATFDSSMRFLQEDPWERLSQLREKIPNILFQMLFRGSNAVGYSNYPDNVVKGFVKHAADRGMDIFRIFDSLNYTPNMKAAIEAVRETGTTLCEAAICYTGDITDPSREKYSLKYYIELARELKEMGAHILCIKDMAGLCRPYAAEKLVHSLKEEVGLPVHFHTHDTSGINAASILKASEAGVDIVDAALSSMSGSTSQPGLNSIVASLENTERDTKLDRHSLDEFSDYWESVRKFYFPFDTSPPHGTAEVYLHEMPGGQFTNLKEQAEAMGLGHRWPEIAQCYAEVNDLFGDIVKVTPSSKVVGDMTMFLVTQGIKPSDVTNLPKNTAFPESVVDMLCGGLGQPLNGWPSDVQQIIVGKQNVITDRPGDHADPVDFDSVRAELEEKIGHPPSENDFWGYLMYPQVFLEFAQKRKRYSNLSVLPTPAYFYGLHPGEEISIDIEVGKTLFVRLINIGEPDSDAKRSVIFELNGTARHAVIKDSSLAPTTIARPKAESDDEAQIGAPMPGLVSELSVSIGQNVNEGDSLLTLEAMKMYTTVSAPHSGTVDNIEVGVGDNIETGDLLLNLNPS
ncbi:MAG: pyruvate carboxylase [Verrucomicrobiaceae bacterium]|nr:pyruvate carboxylase [Verrucomicrobiaceae bacterium]